MVQATTMLLFMSFVWLVACPENVLRVDGKRCQVPSAPGFERLCSQRGLQKWVCHREKANSAEYHVVALSLITPGQLYQGPLTRYSAEETVLWQYFRRRTDMISYNIAGVCALRQSARVRCCQTLAAGTGRDGDRHHSRLGHEVPEKQMRVEEAMRLNSLDRAQRET